MVKETFGGRAKNWVMDQWLRFDLWRHPGMSKALNDPIERERFLYKYPDLAESLDRLSKRHKK